MSRTNKRPRRFNTHQSKLKYCPGKGICGICERLTEYKNKRQSNPPHEGSEI